MYESVKEVAHPRSTLGTLSPRAPVGLFPRFNGVCVRFIICRLREDLLGQSLYWSFSLAESKSIWLPGTKERYHFGSQVLDGFLDNQLTNWRSSLPGAMSWVCANQVLNRAAFLVDSVGFTVEDVIENIFGKRLSVWNL